ncbi:RNA-directed DNA polymerase [Gordonia alkanivorans]|uniref:RNA-directed DNA polymerase n=1 Tax=Gordonia alkanivorans TaxID=84096 RepID=UPI002449C6F0|nr:RNA-directed DNA polymerase [Gordonia alkanivorans]MDH3048680.1 RNA-directed DNA polymerase [Gordonia alkanivorans]
MYKADGDLLKRLDIPSALKDEVSAPRRNLLPPQIADQAAQEDLDEVASIIDVRARQGRVGNRAAPVLAASKWRHGRRSAVALPLPERVLYRAATDLLNNGLAPARQPDDYQDFLRAPTEGDSEYVVVTDLANFYSTIDINRLADLLLSRTGEWSLVSWLREFLTSISPSTGGLPQGNHSSDRLADTYADTLLRRMRRRGLAAFRFSDDFRIEASSYQQGIDALETFDEELRSMGLFLNERKTYIIHRERYIENTHRDRDSLTEAWKEKRDELTSIDMYSFELVIPEGPEVLSAVAIEELEAWADQVKEFRHNDTRDLPTRLDLGLVLTLLAVTGKPEGLRHIPELLLFEPQLTYQASSYMHELSETDASGVDTAIQKAFGSTGLSTWKSAWLCHSLSNTKREEDSSGRRRPLDPAVLQWLKTKACSRDEVLSSHAVWSLAVMGELTQDIWSHLDQESGTYSSQFAAAALSGLTGVKQEQLNTGDALDKIIYEWAASLL